MNEKTDLKWDEKIFDWLVNHQTLSLVIIISSWFVGAGYFILEVFH